MLRPAWRFCALTPIALATAASLTACDMGKLTVNQTAKVLARAQPAINQESDYELAARAIPATLKTVEGFHFVSPDNGTLTAMLAEGYCQYATGFIEDEWERDQIRKDSEAEAEDAERGTKANLRCMNYGLEMLGESWKKAIAGDVPGFVAKVQKAGKGSRDGLLWVALGLAGAINFNRDDVGLVAQLPKAKAILERLAVLDEGDNGRDPAKRALPHIGLGMIAVALPKALGGDPALGAAEFQKAMTVTKNKFLLAKVLFARRYAVAVQDKALFRKTLIEVLQTDPAIWPEQRLANEIAHRRARRYLKQEKEWF